MEIERPLNLNFLSTENSLKNTEDQGAEGIASLKIQELEADLQAKKKKLSEQQKKIRQLEAENSHLKQVNTDTCERQQQLEVELKKAEDQFIMIEKLLLGQQEHQR